MNKFIQLTCGAALASGLALSAAAPAQAGVSVGIGVPGPGYGYGYHRHWCYNHPGACREGAYVGAPAVVVGGGSVVYSEGFYRGGYGYWHNGGWWHNRYRFGNGWRYR